MPDGTAPSIRKGRKYGQVLAGARSVFFDQGFDGASVDDIAKAAGVSKATLYSYFPDKRLLFVEVVRAECDALTDATFQLVDYDTPAREFLTAAGRTILSIFLSDFGTQFYRMSVTEGPKFAELAAAFYEAGPVTARREFRPFFEAAEARGELS
ncbi:MAG: TetR/AcrR family transcriptional regulator, partial [Shimia sp.]